MQGEHELEKVNEHRFGSEKLEGANIISNGERAVISVNDEELKGIIDQNPLINQFLNTMESNPNLQLLVDSGALVQGLTNREVAEHISNSSNKNVIYFDTERDQLMCITTDHGITSMPDLIDLVKSGKIDKSSIKAFFDQARATGTDIMKVLLDDAEIMLTASTGMEKK